MKRNVLSLSSLVLIAIFATAESVQAVESSDATSNVSVMMEPGKDNESYPPVDGEDPEDPNNPGTGNQGTLTIDRVPNITFGEINISGSDQSISALNSNPYTQVTDVRGTSAGWTLFAKAEAFKSDSDKELTGATLALTNGEVKSASAGSSITKPDGAAIVLNPMSQRIMTANENAGEGTWVMSWKKQEDTERNNKIKLNILAGTAKAHTEYKTTIVWELHDTPNK